MTSETPALLYHKVTPKWDSGITSVFPQQFKRQMQYIADSGWQAVGIPSNIATDPIREKQFYLIFDDGYASIHEYALPILKELQFKATIFMPTGYIGGWNDWDHQLLGRRFRHLDWEMLSNLVAEGWTIGSHTCSHRDLTQYSADKMKEEFVNSKAILEQRLGIGAKWISFPFGRYNSEVIKAAIEAGYVGGVVPTIKCGAIESFELIRADAIYLVDSCRTVQSFLTRSGIRYTVWRPLKRAINRASGGTIFWQRLFR